MLIDDENIRVQYDSTAESPIMAGDALPFPFRFIEKEQVKAILLDGTKLVFNEDYTVGLEEEEEEKPEGEDEASVSSDYTSVILNIDIPIGETITLYRETDLDQTSEFPQEARFSSRKIEDALDKLTMQNQEQREALGRAMKLPLTAAVDLKDLALPNPEPNKSVKWNSDGTALVNTSFDPDTALVTTENFKNQAQQSAKDSADSAASSANSATVAGQKVNEITALHSEYMDDINTTSTNYLNQINSRGNTIIKDADAIINRVGYSMFDTVVKDHLLTYEESKGLALQGTWVYKTAIAGERYGYADFYSKCLEEMEEAIATGGIQNITLGGTTIAMFIHTNGHMYYDIGIKDSIDNWFNIFGTAWFYGVDTANERIFLPRTLWFEQMTNNKAEVGLSVEAGVPNITGSFTPDQDCMTGARSGAFNSTQETVTYQLRDHRYTNANIVKTTWHFNASQSNAIYGKSNTVQPNAVKKLLYICVGNQVQDTSWIDIVTQVQGGVKELEEAKDEALDELKNIAGGTVPLGFIGFAGLGIDETLNLQRYLNGQIILQDQFKGFTQFLKRRIELYPSLACTEDEWQTEVIISAFSQCGKFVIDDKAGTIRLPKVVNIQGLTDLSKLGEVVEAGLPNITGEITIVDRAVGGASTGAFYSTNISNRWASWATMGDGGALNHILDASRSNATYGKSNTVQPESIQYPYFIQVATGAEIEDNITNKIELNIPYSFGDSKYNPKPLNNLSWLKSEGQWNSKAVYPSYYEWALTNFNNGVEGFALSTGEYTDYDVVINSAEETFRLPLLDGSETIPDYLSGVTIPFTKNTANYTAIKNCILRLGFFDETYICYINNRLIMDQVDDGTGNNSQSNLFFLKKGDVFSTNVTGVVAIDIYNCIGNGSLYFYVGETVQNANLINAGRIEEKLVDTLGDKLDVNLSNATRETANKLVSYGFPDWWNSVQQAVNTNYIAVEDGWILASGITSQAEIGVKIDGWWVAYTQAMGGQDSSGFGCLVPVNKGQQYTAINSSYIFFLPCRKGGL